MIIPLSACVNDNFYQTHFKSKKINKQKDLNNPTINKPMVLSGVAFITAFGITAAAISSKQNVVNYADKINLLKNEMSKYLGDVAYRKSILREMSLPEGDYYKLRSIIGVEEFDAVIKDLSKDKENFLPGIKTFRADKEPIFGRENVETGKFAANLHLHTDYSDGTISVEEMLEQAVNYANDRVAKLGEKNPFYLAITDHDTIQGCRDVVNTVLKNPEKYKNLRLVLGVENTVITSHAQHLKEPVETHMISYCINPFDKELFGYYQKQIEKNKANIRSVLDYANETYFKTLKKYSVDYNLNEIEKMAPQIKYRNIHSNYLTKDYLQFKLIYSSMVEKNTIFWEEVGLKPENMDFVSPMVSIEKTPDYSKGQKYYDYYLVAVKKDLKSKLPKEKHSVVDKYLCHIPDEVTSILNNVENAVGNKTSKLYVNKVEYPTFEKAIKFLTTKDGALGIAHPGVVFPMKNLKTNQDTLKFYDELYAAFKKNGGDKAKYAEDNYAVYFEDQNTEYLSKLAEISSKYKLEKTGGLDTHISDIFSSK